MRNVLWPLHKMWSADIFLDSYGMCYLWKDDYMSNHNRLTFSRNWGKSLHQSRFVNDPTFVLQSKGGNVEKGIW